MNGKPLKLIALVILMLVDSCNEPETVVTNIVQPDGSVLRKIEMKSINDKVEDRFQISDLQVPFDSTWTVKDSCEISSEVDTIWVRRAEKVFRNVNEINLTYKNDSGANRKISRQAEFTKRFRWFNTEFRFSEKIDKKLSFGYPVKDFLNDEELLYFYSPEEFKYGKEAGPDSLKYRALGDSVNKKVENWTYKNLVSGWIGEFSKLIESNDNMRPALNALKSREDELVSLIRINEDQIDSLWSNGIILKEFLGEPGYEKFKPEADTALERISEMYWVDFKDYSVRIDMPGIVTGTNGFIDSSNVLLWPVKSDFFLTEQYEMWAESKIPNRWAWTVSGLFLVFVFTGVVIRIIKKG
jgi:hypothetical protein